MNFPATIALLLVFVIPALALGPGGEPNEKLFELERATCLYNAGYNYHVAGELEEAAEAYTYYLWAVPNNPIAWYNLGCVYSLLEQTDLAFKALEKAIHYGFERYEAVRGDSDLANLATEPRFTELLENAEAALITDTEINEIEMTSTGRYTVALPPDYAETAVDYPVVIVLQGGQSTPDTYLPLTEACGREDIIYLLPRSPYPSFGTYAFTWRAGYNALPGFGAGLREGDDAPDYRRLYCDWIAACLKDVRENYRTDGESVFVVGHSWGGEFAHSFSVLYPELSKGYLSYDGWFSDIKREKPEVVFKPEAVVSNELSIYLFSGRESNVPTTSTDALEAYLNEAGYERVTVKDDFDAGHGLNEEVQGAIAEVVDKEVRGR